MKLTDPLLKQSQRWLWKNVWKTKGQFQDKPAFIPRAVAVSGLEIVDPLKKEPVPKWIPPVIDTDPQFKPIPPTTEWPNYNEEPAYVYTRGQRMMEGIKQALILTKSVEFQGLPDHVQDLVGQVQVEDKDKFLQRCIMQSQIWDPSKEKLPKRIDTLNVGYKFSREYGIPKKRSIATLMRNLIRLCQTTGDQFPSVVNNIRVIPDSYLGTHYYFRDKLVTMESFSKFLLASDYPLRSFAGEETIDESVNETIPDMFPLSPFINIEKKHLYTIQNIAGFKEDYKKLHPHTIFLMNNNFWSDELNQAAALLHCFGYAMVEARKQFGKEVNRLTAPVCVQCVNMNQSTLNFTFFQLNTTNFSSNDGIKNFVWFDSGNSLFKKQLPQPWRGPEYEQTYYHSYNSMPFDKLLATILGSAPEFETHASEEEPRQKFVAQ